MDISKEHDKESENNNTEKFTTMGQIQIVEANAKRKR